MSAIKTTFTTVPDGPFSLSAADGFGFGAEMARPTSQADTMASAFVTDSVQSQAGVYLRQDNTAKVHSEVLGAADPRLVKKQVARVLSLDQPGRP